MSNARIETEKQCSTCAYFSRSHTDPEWPLGQCDVFQRRDRRYLFDVRILRPRCWPTSVHILDVCESHKKKKKK